MSKRNFMNKESQKGKSLNKVFVEYFELIDSYFGSIRRHLDEGERSHIELGHKIAGYPLISDLILDTIEEIDRQIYDFWHQNYRYVKEHIDEHDGLKCLYSGDISPLSLERFIRKTALYVDTTILPDPLLNLAYFMRPSIADNKFYLNKLIRHVFNIWKMKDLILAKTEYPIIILYPVSIQLISDKERLLNTANTKYLRYLSTLFGKDFDDEIKLNEFLIEQNSPQGLFAKIKKNVILPNRYRQFEGFNSLLTELNHYKKYFHPMERSTTPGEIFGQYIRSQFIRVQEHKFFCERFSAEPIYDYEPPWFFLNYDMGGQDIDSAILNALQREQFEWVGKVPLSVISKLREEEELEYMRSILREGILSIRAKKDKDLSLIIDQLQDNFERAFERQKSELKRIKQRVEKITKREVPITIVGVLLGFIPFIGNYLSLPFVAKDLFGSYKEYKGAREKLDKEEKTAINLLMKSYEDQRK